MYLLLLRLIDRAFMYTYLGYFELRVSPHDVQHFVQHSIDKHEDRRRQNLQDQLRRLADKIPPLRSCLPQRVRIEEFRSLEFFQGQKGQTSASLAARVYAPEVGRHVDVVELDVAQVPMVVARRVEDDFDEHEGDAALYEGDDAVAEALASLEVAHYPGGDASRVAHADDDRLRVDVVLDLGISQTLVEFVPRFLLT